MKEGQDELDGLDPNKTNRGVEEDELGLLFVGCSAMLLLVGVTVQHGDMHDAQLATRITTNVTERASVVE